MRSERALVACDASRTDLLLGLSAAHGSRAGPHMAAVLVTGGVKLNRRVESILEVRRFHDRKPASVAVQHANVGTGLAWLAPCDQTRGWAASSLLSAQSCQHRAQAGMIKLISHGLCCKQTWTVRPGVECEI